MRRLALLIVALAAPAHALTPPAGGAAAKPVDLALRLPFQDGVRVRVTSGYGPNGGSSLHDHTNRANGANDYHALDLVLPDFASNGLGQPVVAAAGGIVVKAGWATAGWANYGLRVIIRSDGPDGARYHHSYCHLDQVRVQEGQQVDAGQPLGALGDSCQGDQQNRACPFFNAHLHFVLHRESTVGGSGTGGSYGGQAVVPEVIDGYEDVTAGQVLVAGNGGPVGPRPPCDELGPEGGVLEDDGPCHAQYGDPRWWHSEGVGHGGHLFWTLAIDGAPDNHARWAVHLRQAGDYTVEAHIEPAFAQSQRARYVVRHDGREDEVRLDQSGGGGWRALGTWRFAAGGDQWVHLYDNTGEALAEDRKLVFDAIRLRPAAPRPPVDAEPEPEPPVDAEPEPPPVDAGAPADAAIPPEDAWARPERHDLGFGPADGAIPRPDGWGPGPDSGEGGPVDLDPARDDDRAELTAGGCRATHAPGPLWLLALLALGPRRRRRR